MAVSPPTWFQWVLSTSIAGIAATFALIAYMHTGFTSVREFKTHQITPHKDAVSQEMYKEDLRDLRARIEAQQALLHEILREIRRR